MFAAETFRDGGALDLPLLPSSPRPTPSLQGTDGADDKQIARPPLTDESAFPQQPAAAARIIY